MAKNIFHNSYIRVFQSRATRPSTHTSTRPQLDPNLTPGPQIPNLRIRKLSEVEVEIEAASWGFEIDLMRSISICHNLQPQLAAPTLCHNSHHVIFFISTKLLLTAFLWGVRLFLSDSHKLPHHATEKSWKTKGRRQWDSRGGSPVDEGDQDMIPVRYLLFLKEEFY